MIQMVDFPPRLEDLRKIADRKASENRDIRDGLNVKMKEHIGTRNEFNTEVRNLITEVQTQKGIRDEANSAVRDAKSERGEKNQEVRDAKDKLRALSPERETGGDNNRRRGRDKEDTPASLRRKIEVLEGEFAVGKHTGSNEKKAMHRMKAMKRKLRDMQDRCSIQLHEMDILHHVFFWKTFLPVLQLLFYHLLLMKLHYHGRMQIYLKLISFKKLYI